jgi:hypothetical protein
MDDSVFGSPGPGGPESIDLRDRSSHRLEFGETQDVRRQLSRSEYHKLKLEGEFIEDSETASQ